MICVIFEDCDFVISAHIETHGVRLHYKWSEIAGCVYDAET